MTLINCQLYQNQKVSTALKMQVCIHVSGVYKGFMWIKMHIISMQNLQTQINNSAIKIIKT